LREGRAIEKPCAGEVGVGGINNDEELAERADPGDVVDGVNGGDLATEDASIGVDGAEGAEGVTRVGAAVDADDVRCAAGSEGAIARAGGVNSDAFGAEDTHGGATHGRPGEAGEVAGGAGGVLDELAVGSGGVVIMGNVEGAVVEGHALGAKGGPRVSGGVGIDVPGADGVRVAVEADQARAGDVASKSGGSRASACDKRDQRVLHSLTPKKSTRNRRGNDPPMTSEAKNRRDTEIQR